jgi:hypothetical protein
MGNNRLALETLIQVSAAGPAHTWRRPPAVKNMILGQ